MRHVTETVRRGLTLSGCPEREAREAWKMLDDVDRFRLRREMGVESEGDFVRLVREEAGRERARRAEETRNLYRSL